jgi:hypothetical protein
LRALVVVVAAVAVVVTAACATPRLDDPPLAVEISVTGLRQDERLELKDRVCAIEGVNECLLVADAPPPAPPSPPGKKRVKAKETPPPPSPEAKITFGYRGSLGELRYKISKLPHPGLEALRADVRLGFRGFDNKAPSIELLEPQDKIVISEKTVAVRVKVPDVDTAAVDIGDADGVRAGEIFSATLENLHEGDNPIVIKATDQAGNARELPLTVVVDTTPPELQVEVQILAYDKAVVRGKVSGDAAKITIDGREVKPDLFGSFEKEVAVDPDKSTCDVVAVDDHNNSKKIKRSVKVASPMSDQSAK